jgi:uncharacterized protein (DUF427 family)
MPMSTTALENRKILNGDPGGSPDGPPLRIEPCGRRVRVVLAGRTIVDSTDVKYLFERDHLPVYYFPLADVDQTVLERSEKTTHCPRKGDASYWSVRVGDRVAPDAVWGYETPIEAAGGLAGHVAFYWKQFDHWYEEDEEVFVHPRDPYKRVDTLPSSRHVRIERDGVLLAESRRPVLLFETGIATRFYLPRADVKLDRLQESDTITQCPYKGRASYYSARIGDELVPDLAWTYTFPVPEAPRLEQLIAFFDEHVDTWVDGELRPRPVSNWS